MLALDDGEEGLSFGQAIMVADQQIDKMRLAAQAEREPEGISSLDRILPGLSGKIADLLFASPRSAAGPGVPFQGDHQGVKVAVVAVGGLVGCLQLHFPAVWRCRVLVGGQLPFAFRRNVDIKGGITYSFAHEP